MRIMVRRTGGFAGIDEEVGSLDTAGLAGEAQGRLEGLVHDAGFFGLPAVVEGDVGADQFRYEVTVEDGGRAHTVTFVGDQGPQVEALRRIVDAAGAGA